MTISASGNSPSVVAAVELARSAGAITIALPGRTGGRLEWLGHLTVQVPADGGERIEQVEDAHLAIGHSLCVALLQRLRGRRYTHASGTAVTVGHTALAAPVQELVVIERRQRPPSPRREAAGQRWVVSAVRTQSQ